jgi:hypothetical protein
MAGGIREFARLRFQSAETLRKSAADFNDPIRDTYWLERLIQAKNYFYNDPLALATVYKYFPNLYRLFITALAATGDYGYSEEDPLNNHKQIMENMFKAFGTNEDGESVFKPVWAIDNFTTAQKIEKAIKDTGAFSNTPPATPDIFHLRIGAANFYVPPITISVNTGFKTGSLTGGAIRQKASPKYNSGYKETTISLKLYFPNYEEIWGTSIDDASKINLNSNYYIDFKDSPDERKIDKFLSSLRGLVAAFKYAPILPIKNHYLNSVFDITGVALTNMTISTVPNYPFTLEVDLELSQFNHKPFLPMIKDFNQAVHWGKFRHYMGRAAGSLANSVNSEFLLNTVVEEVAPIAKQGVEASNGDTYNVSPYGAQLDTVQPYRDGLLTTNVMNDWVNGRNITLYIPAEVQSKIYSPDVSSFRSEEEKAVLDYGRAFWENILFRMGIDITDPTLYRNLDTVVVSSLNNDVIMTERQRVAKIVDVALAGSNAKNIYEMTYDALAIDYINSNNITNAATVDYLKNRKSPNDLEVPAQSTEELTRQLKEKKFELYNASQTTKGMLDYQIRKNTEAILKKKKIDFDKTKPENSKDWRSTYAQEQAKFVDAFMVSLYERVFKDESIQQLLGVGLIRDAEKYSKIDGRKISAFTIREWEVPMMKIDLNPNNVIVNSVSLSMGNNLAKLQLQMQEEPTFQYIGSKDSMVSISMTIFGEDELRKIRKMFEFLSGLARLEHAAGVIGFMGIKNIVCALAGIKYVLPVNYSVDTVPGFPHVYNVNLMLVDFDIFQQKRENISSEQQIALIKEFGTKRNPFLRLKQKWGAFNAYPDMPLSVEDPSTKEYVGSLDPDFYFRSFETFDNDVVNNIIDPNNYTLPIGEWENEKTHLNDRGKSFVYFVKKKLIENNGNIEEIKNYLINENNLPADEAMKVFRIAIFDQQIEPEFETSLQSSRFIANKYPNIWKDMIELFKDDDDVEYNFDDVKFDTRYGSIRVGDLMSGSKEQVEKFNKLIAESAESSAGNQAPSFDPDDVDHFGMIHLVPAADPKDTNKIPAIYQTPDGGYVMGYSNREDGRFYVSQDFLRVSSNGKLVPTSQVTQISDTQSPEREKQDSHTGVPGAKSLDGYMSAYGSSGKDTMQTVSTGGSHKGVAKHWQKMMMDTQYRDLSGRMVRAYPTYMLWLIDDGNYFAGVKLFDNFYGLQSIIDFSIVQSEDILGDTLMLRISNTYSKLSKPEASLSSIVNMDGQLSGGVTNAEIDKTAANLAGGSAKIVETLIRRSMNMKSHMNSRYVTEINQMRLKPGVRVHLRAGYGANPNSLQTIFNGVIAEVDHGEIITVIAQSDAVELSPIINSTKKKGDSGKIDGGINTGLWMSEPRDLMIRLLSMGASRTREAFAHATRGAVFSENKFGIRHFGSILYKPLTPQEEAKSSMYKQSVINAFNATGRNPITGTAGLAWNSAANIITGGIATTASLSTDIMTGGIISPPTAGGLQSFGGSVRTPVLGAMQTLWGNFSTQRDLEIFKRNIYPGNGVGVAQFLGGDLDDGWATMASIDISEIDREKFGYADRLSNRSWSGLIEQSQNMSNIDANQVLERSTAGNELVDSSKAVGTSKIIGGALAVGAGVTVGNFIAPGAGLLLGAKLGKSLQGRGFTNVMKTLGLVSDLDDDIYDEVSFRAQTYMRSVWDMFQMCARLLPNYIVAVRPFEDRSTIFYGKPHWLYTSGVYPISTGFPNEEQAKMDGVSIPGYIDADDSLQKILDTVNKEQSPIADALAVSQSTESSVSESIAAMSKDMLSFSGIFRSGAPLRGKVINFLDENRSVYKHYDEIVSRLPVNRGKVQVGFHLPFGPNGEGTEAPIQVDKHKQIDQLPIRFRYPFFTNRTSGILPSLDYDKIVRGNTQEDFTRNINNIVAISLLEKGLISKEKDSESTALVSDKNGETTLDFNFSFAAKLPMMGIDELLTGTAAFDPSGIYDPNGNLGQINASYTVQMPLPIITENPQYFVEKFQEYYDDLDPVYALQQEFNTLPLNFRDWGMPKTAEEEQFYIAMRWPYNPIPGLTEIASKVNKTAPTPEVQKEVLKKFLKMYNFQEEDLVGSPEEYKKRRVLVYNEQTNTAVVCAPAYFLWGETESDEDGNGSNKIDAIVSPDAAYFLGLLINSKGQILSPLENIESVNSEGVELTTTSAQWEILGMAEQNLSECRFTFVSDTTPLGVVTSTYNPANAFRYVEDGWKFSEENFLVGFGAFKASDGTPISDILDMNDDRLPAKQVGVNTSAHPSLKRNTHTGVIIKDDYTFDDQLALKTAADWTKEWSQGGNYLEYYDKIISNELGELSQDNLFDEIKKDREGKKNEKFAAVYDPLDAVSVTARGFYDEKFDSTVKVIAGNGRRVAEAQQIWDQFRYGYHTYDSVKNIFQQVYNLDPDDDKVSTDPIFSLLTWKTDFALEEFGADTRSSEFTTLLGADWISSVSAQTAAKQSAIDIAVDEYIDGGYDGVDENSKPLINKDKGILDAYNALIINKATSIRELVRNHFETYDYAQPTNPEQDPTGKDISEPGTDGQSIYERIQEKLGKIKSTSSSEEKAKLLLESVESPKQLFLLLVGIFRQKMWSDPYARAWLVLRPDKKRYSATGWGTAATVAATAVSIPFGATVAALDIFGNENDQWSFRSVDKMFHAFIDYNAQYASNSQAFIKLLQKNAKEGNNASNWVTGIGEDAIGFWDRNIGPIFTAFDAALGNLLNMFRMSMAQMGYGLQELENFTKQANILNKAYNDSIYYSLGRPGTLLRAVDNPFTREYGEPVVEIREPFQRMHYLSSFTHILSNNIKENGKVATQITAVSDGKYPVTVSLDKSAPAEKQVEKTVETGLYFDNAKGEGVFGILHPIFHPLETARGIAKHAQGEPDELTARRVALAYLKESLKDIYGGEIIVVGNADIRPHDLVYLADVYERMYGIFEVEQVVHHFTPETGFITSITPNAFVSVNDPARWFMSSWCAAHFSMMNLRNDAKLLLLNKSNNSRLTINGDVSIDNLGDMLKDQMMGGMQYTHGHTALLRDIQANQLADSLPDTNEKVKQLIKNNTGKTDGSAGAAIFAGLVMPAITATATAATFVATGGTGALAAGAVAAVGAGLTDAAWSAWKWVRNNVLDQHGCYIQYLSKNGQPMDAGLSNFQGMVVGKYHSKRLLPGILGVRSKVKTADGHAFVRSDDLLSSFGWKEKEISALVRHISLENAIVQSEILKYSGLGPEKTGLNEFFKAIVKVTHVKDGDTIKAYDVLTNKEYDVRFEGINTAELAKNNVTSDTAIINPNSPASKALHYTKQALEGKLFVLRISPNNPAMILTADDFEAGAAYNNPENYLAAYESKTQNWDDRYMASVFYRTDKDIYNSIYLKVRGIFLGIPESTSNSIAYIKEKVKESISPQSVVYTRFDTLYDAIVDEQAVYTMSPPIYSSVPENGYIHFESLGETDALNGLTNLEKKAFDAAISILILYRVYEKAAEWPMAEWNEYYNDGSPITLNWELVTTGLAQVYTKGLLAIKGPALYSVEDVTPIPREVE